MKETNYNDFDYIVVGTGFSGTTIAERIANALNKKVLVIEKRNHIGGNVYDYVDKNGILIHKYGPHLFHTNLDNVYTYLTQFGDWFKYEHRVLGKVKNKLVPIPFNLTSIRESFEKEKADKLINILKSEFGLEKKVPILELRKHSDKDINELAEFIYENVFLYYTMKQWGKTPDEIDPNVTNRVPVFISEDDRYFQDKYQFMPKHGYTKIFNNMLNSKNISVLLETDIKDILTIKNDRMMIDGAPFKGKIIYTGALDELLDYEYGELPYRTLEFDFEMVDEKYYQPVGTVNYPTKEDKFTRITEYKHMTMQNCHSNNTTIMREYPKEYIKGTNEIPYYPVNNNVTEAIYQKYLDRISKISNLYLLGRLAQYKYYNMDLIINEALNLFERLKEIENEEENKQCSKG